MRMLILIFSLLLGNLSVAQDSIEFKKWFLKEDGKTISQLFAQSVNIELPESKDTYNKAQATIIVSNFLNKIEPNNYKRIHFGGGDKRSHYEIGILQTEKSKYRTYLLYNENEGEIEVVELRIELEE